MWKVGYLKSSYKYIYMVLLSLFLSSFQYMIDKNAPSCNKIPHDLSVMDPGF